jgi:hypothetical protein
MYMKNLDKITLSNKNPNLVVRNKKRYLFEK